MTCLGLYYNHALYALDPSGFHAVETARKILNTISTIDPDKRRDYLINGIDATTLQQRIGHTKAQDVRNALKLLDRCNELAIFDEGKKNWTVVLREDSWPAYNLTTL